MEKEKYTSNQLFGIFYLREQLHGYLDVFEDNYFEISKQIEYQNAIVLLNNKRFMTSLAEKQFYRIRHVEVENASIFHRPVTMWLNPSAINDQWNGVSVKDALITFDKKVMAWCYLCMVDEDCGMQLSEFLLKMIEYSKNDANFMLSETRR